jgi:hypothetical protein
VFSFSPEEQFIDSYITQAMSTYTMEKQITILTKAKEKL